MKAIVDCNSFYCSCERLFRPELEKRPVVVLSNNDGCIISRTDEAKTLGVEMAGPYFMAKPIIEKFGVECFSSNYNLYGDLSWRVMETLRALVGPENVEVYSVDEAFLELGEFAGCNLRELGLLLRRTVEEWTGIKVSVGIADTKVLSKVANRLAKKDKQGTDCVVVLDTPTATRAALMNTPVADLWGIGSKYAWKLTEVYGIYNGFDLSRQKEEWCRKNLGGIVGVRLLKELNGTPSIGLKEELVDKKMIATTRMFGRVVSSVVELREAVATYTARAAEKLRRQNSAASMVSVFLVPHQPKTEGRFSHGPTLSTYATLPCATSATNELIKPAVKMLEMLYKPGQRYKKAGVLLSGLVPDRGIQGNLFVANGANNHRLLMSMVDNINFSMRSDMVKFATGGVAKDWKMRMELRSPRYTTRWGEMFSLMA